jgi:hypothetical protein
MLATRLLLTIDLSDTKQRVLTGVDDKRDGKVSGIFINVAALRSQSNIRCPVE